ncbi:LysR family transcriptional regulator [Paracoccus marcusii]|uniref:LysR family transcriptional regulator n=1 Tax=Paracoccus marcusii TaxID=59779 RepID=UPI0039C85740
MRALRAVADSGSLTLAAAQLGLSPPAIHSQLKSLEDLAGAPLLQRAEHGAFRATAQGRALLMAEAQIATALARAGREVASLAQGTAATWSWGGIHRQVFRAVPGRHAATRPAADRSDAADRQPRRDPGRAGRG